MSKFDVKETAFSVQTVEEFDDLLEKFKISNPAKYAVKLASGEFEAFRKTLVSSKPVKEPAKEETKKKV